MITEIFISMFVSVSEFFLSLFPKVSIPDTFLNSVSGFVELLGIISFFIPVDVFQLALGVFLSFHALEFVISIVNWIIAKIPTIE